jgi:Tfp pilus assembly protein PilZ
MSVPRSRGHRRHLTTRSGQTFAADEIVWVTQAGGPAWLQGTGLALDDSRLCTRQRAAANA